MRLTKSILDRATYQGSSYQAKDGHPKWTRYVLWDDAVPGLGLRITPAGRKSFVLSYRTGGRKRLLTLGAYGPLTLAEARERARRRLLSVIDGRDPLEDRSKDRSSPTFRDLAKRYLEEHARPKKKPRSVVEDERLLKRVLLPALRSRAVKDLDREDITRVHHSQRETPFQANRTLALLSVMLNLAEQWGMRPDGSNPCRHVKRYPERRRERFLSGEELVRLGEVLAEAEADGSEPPEAIAAIRLLLLTGCRKSEILTLRWEHVDFERRCLMLPDSKTGAKAVPLGAVALDVLAGLPRVGSSPYVLPGRNGKGHLIGLHRPWARLRAKAGLDAVRLHDLRHHFASVGAGGGLGLPILGKILGHRTPATTARYSHLADDPLQRAADQISGEIAGALFGGRGQVVEAEQPGG